MAKGPIPPLPGLQADPVTLNLARTYCAERCRDRGEHERAASYLRGEQDLGWAIRHEVNRLNAEAGASA